MITKDKLDDVLRFMGACRMTGYLDDETIDTVIELVRFYIATKVSEGECIK